MKGLILQKGERGYSYFKKTFCGIDALSQNYKWMLSNLVCYPQSDVLKRTLQDKKFVQLSGLELKQILEFEDFQLIWGVLSGFPNHIAWKEILPYSLPYADGYNGFWHDPLTLQHPLATAEFVAWDSRCTLFISKDDRLIYEVSRLYPQAEDLAEYNRSICYN